MSSDMQFWSLAVPPGGSETQDIEQTPETAVYLHLTNVALAGDGGGVPHTIAVTVNGKQCVLATLQKGQAMQHTLDVLLDESVTFTNSGKAPVHVSGYLTMSSADDYEGESDDDEDEDEDEDDEDAPMGVPLHNGKPKRKLLQSPGDDDDDDDDDDEGEEDEDEEDGGPRLKPSKRLEAAMYGEGDSDDEGGEFELDSDDIVGEFEDDEDEGEEEDEDEEEEQKKAEPPKGKAGKRAPVTTTPAPAAKKAKTEVAKASASAPPKMQKQQKQDKQEAPAQKQPATAQKPAATKAAAAAGPSDGGDAAKSYEKLLVDYLSKQPNKTAPLSQLGSSVKRPPGVQKLTAFLKSKPGQFKHDEKGGTVALLK